MDVYFLIQSVMSVSQTGDVESMPVARNAAGFQVRESRMPRKEEKGGVELSFHPRCSMLAICMYVCMYVGRLTESDEVSVMVEIEKLVGGLRHHSRSWKVCLDQ